MNHPQNAETVIRHHAQHTARLVEERSRVRVPNTGKRRLARAFWRTAG